MAHELVLDSETKASKHKMVIKACSEEATYHNRVRIRDWLLANVSISRNGARAWALHSRKRISALAGDDLDLPRCELPSLL